MNNGYDQHFKKIKQNVRGSGKLKTKPKAQKTRRPFPVTTLVSAVSILTASTWLYMNIEKAENWLSKVEIRIFGSAIASDGSAKKEQNLPSAKGNVEKKSPEQTEGASAQSTSERNLTPEELTLFNKLEERRGELDKRETELKKLEEELQHQKVMLEEKMKALESLRTNIASQLDDRVKADETQVEKLVAMYSNMKPQRAAKILETVNEDLAVEVLRNMKRDKAADILNMLDSAKAQKLSEKFAGYRKD